ncbi:SEC14-like protein 2 isoform X1 [Dermacentor andersoni]|uniref:SEC14-like protein 2 isoform X1 n=1 Tax=Dermacentor andersoni TaxID=34620 RepID=UPI0021557DF0|nr:SEC14-like protein 2 isoform X1 [Dermacentor andersoni]
MSGYLGNLSARQQAALDQFRHAVADVKRPSHTDAFLLRWLRARDFDVAKAERMYRHDLEWRKENGVDDMLQCYETPEIVKDNFPGAILHPCRDGRPMWLIPVGMDIKAFVAALTPTKVQRHCIYLLEYMESLKRSSEREAGQELENQYLVIDLDKFSIRQVYSWQAIKSITDMLKMMEDHFPECLEKCICINAPNFFPLLWRLVRPMMTHRTADKVKVYGKDDWKDVLLDIMDAEKLPAHWGGNLVGPGNDPRCRHKVNHGGRFEERAAPSVFKDDAVQLRSIGRRERWQLPVTATEVGVRISWRFQTSSGDLGFGVRTEAGETLVPTRRVESCSVEPQEGCWQCDTPGTYILEFDNSYSWLNGKTLAYVVKTHDVNEDS